MNKKSFLIFLAVFIALSIFLVSGGSYSGSLSVSSSGGKIIISGQGPLPEHYCGNDVLEVYRGEDCDGQDLGSETCASLLGVDYSGTLSCKSNCVYNTSNCVKNTVPTTPTSSSGGGSSGGGSSLCIENWDCTDWDVCKEGKQTRTCNDINNCGTTILKPSLERECSVEGQEGEAGIGLETQESQSFFSKITGAVIGGGVTSIVSLIFIAVVLIVAIILYIKRSK